MNKKHIKTLIPVIIFSSLAIWLSNAIDIWYPAEALMGLKTEQAPFIDFIIGLGHQLFGDSVWSIRWSSLIAWGLLNLVVCKGSTYIMGELAAKYTMVILLASTPLLLSIISQPQGLWMILWDSVCLISLFHLLDKNTNTNWRIFFWTALTLSLFTSALHTTIIVLISLLLLPKTYRREFIANSQSSRYLPTLLAVMAGFMTYNYFVVDSTNQYDIIALILNTVGSKAHFDFVMIYGYIIWGIGFVVLLPVVIKHLSKGLRRRSGKMYLLSIWLCISTVFSLWDPMTSIVPLAMVLGLSIYALQQKFMSNKSMRIWAILQMIFGVTATVILLYTINQQFGYWGIFWGIIAGIILMSSTIFLLMMYEGNRFKIAVQGLLSINGFFVILLFAKVLPNFNSIINGADKISLHLNNGISNNEILMIDESLKTNTPLMYHLTKENGSARKIISSKNMSTIKNNQAYTRLSRIDYSSTSIDTTDMTKKDTFYLINFNPNEVIAIEMK